MTPLPAPAAVRPVGLTADVSPFFSGGGDPPSYCFRLDCLVFLMFGECEMTNKNDKTEEGQRSGGKIMAVCDQEKERHNHSMIPVWFSVVCVLLNNKSRDFLSLATSLPPKRATQRGR